VRQGGSVVRLSNHPRFTVTRQEDPRGVQNGGLHALVYACVGLFIGGRQGLHRFTCVKAAWHKTYHKPYIELYRKVLRGICVDTIIGNSKMELHSIQMSILFVSKLSMKLFENELQQLII